MCGVFFFFLVMYSKTLVTKAEEENNVLCVIFFKDIGIFRSLKIRKKKLTIKMVYCY